MSPTSYQTAPPRVDGQPLYHTLYFPAISSIHKAPNSHQIERPASLNDTAFQFQPNSFVQNECNDRQTDIQPQVPVSTSFSKADQSMASMSRSLRIAALTTPNRFLSSSNNAFRSSISALRLVTCSFLSVGLKATSLDKISALSRHLTPANRFSVDVYTWSASSTCREATKFAVAPASRPMTSSAGLAREGSNVMPSTSNSACSHVEIRKRWMAT